MINGDRPRPTPMALGHEAAGIVEDVGAVTTDLLYTWRRVARCASRSLPSAR